MQYPIDLHEDTLPADSPVRLTLNAAREAHQLIVNAHGILGDTTEFVEKAIPVVEKTLARLDTGLRELEAHETKVQGEVASVMAPKPNDIAIPHIVAYLQKQKSPAAVVQKAIAAGDQRIAAVALALPPVVLGLSEEEYALMKDASTEKFAKNLHAQLQTASAAREKLQRAATVFGENMTKLCRPAMQRRKMMESLNV